MAAKRLTDLMIERLQPGPDGRLDVYDAVEPGLLIRVGKKRKTFTNMVTFEGRKQRLPVGQFPLLKIAEARAKAREQRLLAQNGTDPREHERDAKSERQQARLNTVEVVVEEYIERHARPNQRSWRDTGRRLRKDLVALYGHRPIGSLTRADINRMIDQARDRGVTIGANRLLAHTKRFFSWCVERGYIETSPADNVRRPVKEISRDRILSDVELAAVWEACEEIGYPYGNAVRLLMLLGQRRDEISRMRWEDLDLDLGVWTIPASANKSGRLHEVPLSDLAIGLIREVPEAGPYVFWGQDPKIAINGWGRIKKRVDELSGVDGWRIHDLRRTTASGMARLGFEPHIVERVLNHQTTSAGPLARVYQRHDYAIEKQQALEAWSSHVNTLATSDCDPAY